MYDHSTSSVIFRDTELYRAQEGEPRRRVSLRCPFVTFDTFSHHRRRNDISNSSQLHLLNAGSMTFLFSATIISPAQHRAGDSFAIAISGGLRSYRTTTSLCYVVAIISLPGILWLILDQSLRLFDNYIDPFERTPRRPCTHHGDRRNSIFATDVVSGVRCKRWAVHVPAR